MYGGLDSRMLATLFKDERCQQLGALFPLLEKVYMDRILPVDDVESFAATLKPHHLAVTADGSTVLTSHRHSSLRTHLLLPRLHAEPTGLCARRVVTHQ